MELKKIKTLEGRSEARKRGLVSDKAPRKRHSLLPRAMKDLEIDDEPYDRGNEGIDGFTCGRKREDLRGDHPKCEEFAHALVDELTRNGSDPLLAILALRRAAQIFESRLTRYEVVRHKSE